MDVSETIPVPVCVCSCGISYDQRTFDAQPPAAGYAQNYGGEVVPVMGLIWRQCGACETCIAQDVEEWDPPAYPHDNDEPIGAPDLDRGDGDPDDERDAIESRRAVERLWTT